jgi:hypothetical protein
MRCEDEAGGIDGLVGAALSSFLGTFRTRQASFTVRALKRYARERLGVALDRLQPLALSRSIRRLLAAGVVDSKGRLWLLLGEEEEGWRERRTLYRAALAEEVAAGAV